MRDTTATNISADGIIFFLYERRVLVFDVSDYHLLLSVLLQLRTNDLRRAAADVPRTDRIGEGGRQRFIGEPCRGEGGFVGTGLHGRCAVRAVIFSTRGRGPRVHDLSFGYVLAGNLSEGCIAVCHDPGR